MSEVILHTCERVTFGGGHVARVEAGGLLGEGPLDSHHRMLRSGEAEK